jgi:hypothetical protein
LILDRLHSERGGNVGLAGAGTADQRDVMRAIDEVAAVKLADERLIGLAGCKVEPGQILLTGNRAALI